MAAVSARSAALRRSCAVVAAVLPAISINALHCLEATASRKASAVARWRPRLGAVLTSAAKSPGT